jgi:hypothetical protein
MIFKQLYTWGDRLEDRARGRLSHFPIMYAALGGAGIVLFWRGVWHTADAVMAFLFSTDAASGFPWWDGPLCIAVSVILLLWIGLFVTSFIGEAIIISGLKKEKKLSEKTQEEVLTEIEVEKDVRRESREILHRLEDIEAALGIRSVPSAKTSVKTSTRPPNGGSRVL